MPRWKRIALLTAIPIGLLWLLTGGCVVHSYWWLPVESTGKDFHPYLRVEVTRRTTSYGVPLLFRYHTEQPPFGLQITYITHTVVPEPTLKFDRLVIEFADAKVDLTDQLPDGAVPRPAVHSYGDENHQFQERPSLRWETTIAEVLPEATPFSVRITGRLRSGGQSVEEFDTLLHIQLRYETTRRTGWAWLAIQ